MRISQHERFATGHDIPAQAGHERIPLGRHSTIARGGALEILPIGVYERHHDRGNAEDLRREPGKSVEVLRFGRIEKSRFVESGQPGWTG